MPTQVLLGKQIFNIDGDDAPKLRDALVALQTRVDELEPQVSQLTAELTAAKGQVETLTSENSKLEGEKTGLQTKLDEADKTRMDADTIKTEIETRMDAWSAVLPFMRSEKPDFAPDYALDSAEIKRLYLTTAKPELNLDGKDASYIEGLWEALKPAQESRVDGVGMLETAINTAMKTDMSGGDMSMMTNRRKQRGLPGLGGK